MKNTIGHPRVTLCCHVCQQDYIVQWYRRNTSKYCSRKCGQKAKAIRAGEIRHEKRGRGKKHPYVKFYGRHEHRVIAERKLGRTLTRKDVVHHLDHDGHNNAESNLLITTQSDHINIHRSEMMAARKEKSGY